MWKYLLSSSAFNCWRNVGPLPFVIFLSPERETERKMFSSGFTLCRFVSYNKFCDSFYETMFCISLPRFICSLDNAGLVFIKIKY